MDTAAALLAGGDSGALIDRDQPNQSTLLQRLTTPNEDERMPPEGRPVSKETIEAIRNWITNGATVPPNETGEDDPARHWAFQQVSRPTVPDSDYSNPIDAFLESTRRKAKAPLKTQPKAKRSLRIRRLYLDLVGLPPSLDQLEDSRPWPEIVDALLSSPHHGERWGRHWMDIWRYSDWYGLGTQLRNSQKHMWHWRDWIIESLNADKRYDRMITEMLAGDELAPADPDVVRATGFLARNYYLFNRTTWLDNTIEHTGKAFLGLTLNCAKCHDHKYDPLSADDYYRFRAIFEPHQVRLDPVPGTVDLEKNGLPRVYDDKPDAVTHFHRKGDPSDPDPDKVIQPGIPSVFAVDFNPKPVKLPRFAYAPDLRDHVARDRHEQARQFLRFEENKLAKAGPKKRGLRESLVDQRRAELAAVKATLAANRAGKTDKKNFPGLAHKAALCQTEAKLAEARHALLKLPEKEKAKRDAAMRKIARFEKQLLSLRKSDPPVTNYEPFRASRKALETPEHKFEDYPVDYPAVSSGRRLALARWIGSRGNPLTARVAVNHVWLRHFGRPLVESVADFGRRAPEPPHIELLDYLASEFMESGWSFKHLHRLMVTSEAYQRESSKAGADPDTLAHDKDNFYYWRMNPRRLESQIVRDSLLSLSGTLDTTIGGSSVPTENESARRSLYFLHSRDDQDKFLTMFDDADLLACYRRSESIVPQQALALSNSKLALELASKIARRFDNDLEQNTFIKKIFTAVLARSPDESEHHACMAFCQSIAPLVNADSSQEKEDTVRARLVHALINHNDFVTVR